MKKSLYIFIPGLGSEKARRLQRNAVSRWQSETRDARLLEPYWKNDETADEKINRLADEIENLNPKNYRRLILVGASAGGPMVINLYGRLKDKYQGKAVSICGKLKGADSIGRHYSRPHPALIPLVRKSEELITGFSDQDKAKILSLIPRFDEVVGTASMHVGTAEKQFNMISHIPSIWYVVRYRPKLFFKFAA